MPVMGTCRGDRVHLSEQIDLVGKVTAIGSVAPSLDPPNAGANAAGGEGDNVSDAAVVGIRAARAAESKGGGVGGVPQLEPRATDAVEGDGGVDDDGMP